MGELLQQGCGYILLGGSWVWMQVSDLTDGILSKGFDTGLSIGLLIVGLIVLSWYHLKMIERHEKEIQNRQEVIKKLAHDKDERTDDLHNLVVQQLELTKDQIQTNKELREMMKGVINLIQQKQDA